MRARQALETAIGQGPWDDQKGSIGDDSRFDLELGAARCLPTCTDDDGRFLGVASGPPLATLGKPFLEVQVAVPAGSASFDLGIFDGDADIANEDWDIGAASYEYTLFADPDRDGTSTMVAAGPFQSANLPNNAWFDVVVDTDSSAQAPSGNYFYRLRIENLTPSEVALNSFKVRTDGVVSIETRHQPFCFYAAIQSQADALILYPDFPASPTPTTYDGTFEFFLDVTSSQDDLIVWNGDLDRGSYNGTQLDTDDQDTENAPYLPPWATAEAVSEGVATGLAGTTGNPADDTNPSGLGLFLVRSPAIFYTIFAPDGGEYVDDNPSGNREWEKFQVTTTAPLDPMVADQLATALPAGIYEIRVEGADLQNLSLLRAFHAVLCVDATGNPCVPLRPLLLGDLVWLDEDGDGSKGPLESGLAGVVLELLDAAGETIGSTTSGSDGIYSFGVEAGSYSVRVAATNFLPGGGLDGLVLTTTSDELPVTVIDDNDLTVDFGYQAPAKRPSNS